MQRNWIEQKCSRGNCTPNLLACFVLELLTLLSKGKLKRKITRCNLLCSLEINSHQGNAEAYALVNDLYPNLHQVKAERIKINLHLIFMKDEGKALKIDHHLKGNNAVFQILRGGGALVFQAGYHPRKRTFKTHPWQVFCLFVCLFCFVFQVWK